MLDALKQCYPMLCGAIRDHVTKKTASLPALFWLPAGSVFCGYRRTASGAHRRWVRTLHHLGRIERGLRRQMLYLTDVLLLPRK